MVYPGAHAATAPERTAVVMARSGARMTYGELDARSIQLARLLHARGLRPGDTVAILAENHLRYYEVYWAAKRSGLYLTAINRHLSPAEVAYILDDSAASALITTATLAAVAATALESTTGCVHRFVMDGAHAGFDAYEDAVAAQPTTALEHQPRGDAMLYSSGTTGRPKGIRRALSGRTVDDPVGPGTSQIERLLFGMDETSVYLCPAPLYHAAGLLWSAGVHELGGTLVIMEKFDAEEMLAIIEREGVTHTQVVPTMLVRILKLPAQRRERYDVSSLQRLFHSAAPCPPEVKRAMIDWLGPIIDEYYASTEGSGLTYISAADWLTHPGSVGRPLLGIPHICDEDGKELPTGEPGVLHFEQPEATFAYHGDEAKTRASRHPDHPNWTTVGDIGYLDDEGYIYLTDRKSFMIISGGVNIYPAEVESCLVMHPKVADVAVFGMPDPEMGQYVHAVIQPAVGVEATPEFAEELRTFARDNVAHYKVPRVFDFRAELPRMATGKLAKNQLRDEYVAASRESRG